MKTFELARKEVSEQVLSEQGKEKQICREKLSTIEHWLLKKHKGYPDNYEKILGFCFCLD